MCKSWMMPPSSLVYCSNHICTIVWHNGNNFVGYAPFFCDAFKRYTDIVCCVLPIESVGFQNKFPHFPVFSQMACYSQICLCGHWCPHISGKYNARSILQRCPYFAFSFIKHLYKKSLCQMFSSWEFILWVKRFNKTLETLVFHYGQRLKILRHPLSQASCQCSCSWGIIFKWDKITGKNK